MATLRRGAPKKRSSRGFQPPEGPLAPGLAVRLAAAEAYAAILTARVTIDDRVNSSLRVSPSSAEAGPAITFDTRDLSLVRSIVTVSLRRRGTIKHALDRFLEKGIPAKAATLESILITGAAQILFLDIPDHSAVDLAVRCAKQTATTAPFAGLVNAVLRNIIRNRDELLAPDDPFADTPQWLVNRWSKQYGRPTAEKIALAHSQEPGVDLSVRDDPHDWAARLEAIVMPGESVRLKNKTAITELEGYDDGAWWVQDCSARLPVVLLNPQSGEKIADLCAAPGGKTAQLAAAGAQVTAVDRSAQRLKRLIANLQRLQLDADIRASDALQFSGGPFDAVLLDAPCTSTGTIRRHPEIAWNKRQDDLAALATLQGKLLDQACTLLKSGGRLIYCTCSLEFDEGEQQIAALLRRNPDMTRDVITRAEISHKAPGLEESVTELGELRLLPYFLPHEEPRLSGTDGFFIARLLRK